MVGHKYMCLYRHFLTMKNFRILIVLAISTCAYMWGNRVKDQNRKEGGEGLACCQSHSDRLAREEDMDMCWDLKFEFVLKSTRYLLCVHCQ